MKLKFDSKSLKARIGMNFILFAAILMLFLWGAQVLFLNTFYQSMKESTTNNIMRQLKTSYNRDSTSNFLGTVTELSSTNDIYIYIYNTDGIPLISSSTDASFSRHTEEISQVYMTMLDENKNTVSILLNSGADDRKTLACGTLLSASDKPELVAYIISPLFPMDSTIAILKKQLMWVTGLSLILAMVLALYLSGKIATPIRSITKNAAKLARGEYGITFTGGPYTELNELADTLTQTSFELEKSSTLQKDLIANVSHDLKTPLTMVKSYAEMIRDLSGADPVKREKHLQVIIEEADRLNILVNDMLALSRMQSGAITIHPSTFDIREIAESVLTSYKLLMEADGYSVTLECPEKLMVTGDPERIKQVFANLLNNALKFCGEDKSVNVIIHTEGSAVLCQIQDSGPGISEEDLPHIWERYYKSSSNTVRSSTGSGLGLSIVKEILSLHKIPYGVDSTPDKGTTFWFKLNKF